MSDDLRKTFRAILGAARGKRFISYGDLAKANDADWQKVRYEMNRHLGELVKIAAARDWPMPTAIVVNAETGTLDGTARDGFINAAKEFGFDVSDPAAFVEEQQQAMFAWAETASDELTLSEEEQPNTKNKSGPHFVRLFGLLDALRSLGGVGEPKRVFEEIAKSPLVTEEDRKAINKNGGSKYENQVGWARFYLAKAGLIDSKKRGIWQLTPDGRETYLDQNAAIAFLDIHGRFKTTSEEDSDEADAPSDSDMSDLFDDPSRRFWFVTWGGTDDKWTASTMKASGKTATTTDLQSTWRGCSPETASRSKPPS